MKTYKSLLEAISAARLAQLAAKGKGGAAAAQMKADGTKPAQVKPVDPKQPIAKPKPKGGALALRPNQTVKDKAVSVAGNFVKRKAGELAKDQAGKLANRVKEKSTFNKKPSRPDMSNVKPDGPNANTAAKRRADRENKRETDIKNIRSQRPERKAARGFAKFMGNGLKSGITGGQRDIKTSQGQIKGPGTMSHGKSMS